MRKGNDQKEGLKSLIQHIQQHSDTKKLRMIDLQLKKAELERKLNAQSSKENAANGESTDLGIGNVMNRDELIKMILNNNDASNSSKNDK